MITYALLSQAGNRENNEDNVGMFQRNMEYCFTLADGLGGHGSGEVASQTAVEKSIEVFAASELKLEEYLNQAFTVSQTAIIQRQSQDKSTADMKTTLVLFYVGETKLQWGHIGDSRLYYFNRDKLAARTRDHSVPQMLVSAGEIKERQIRNHPDRNRLLRVMGINWETPRHELGPVTDLESSQSFLLCSDGFWELIDEKKMAACLKKAATVEQWLSLMEEIILKNGKNTNMDNYSAIGIWIR